MYYIALCSLFFCHRRTSTCTYPTIAPSLVEIRGSRCKTILGLEDSRPDSGICRRPTSSKSAALAWLSSITRPSVPR